MRIRDNKGFDLQSLRCFVRAAEQGSLTAAATAIGVAQSALSRHIAQLESLLGGRLFHRTGRGVELTELGRTVLPRAQALLVDAGQLVHDAAAVQRRPAGIVNVGVLPSMTRPLVSRLYNRVRDGFPDIQLRVFEAYSGEIEVLLSDGRIDIGIFNRYRPLRREAQDAVFTTEMCLVAKAGAPVLQRKSLRFQALAGLPLVLPMRPNSLRGLLDEIANKQRVPLQVVLEADSSAVIKDAVLNSGLYCVFPPHAVAQECADGLLGVIPISHPVIRQTTFIDATRRHPMTGAAKEVLRLLPRLVQELDGKGRQP